MRLLEARASYGADAPPFSIFIEMASIFPDNRKSPHNSNCCATPAGMTDSFHARLDFRCRCLCSLEGCFNVL